MICDTCGHDNQGTTHFCEKCGSLLPMKQQSYLSTQQSLITLPPAANPKSALGPLLANLKSKFRSYRTKFHKQSPQEYIEGTIVGQPRQHGAEQRDIGMLEAIMKPLCLLCIVIIALIGILNIILAIILPSIIFMVLLVVIVAFFFPSVGLLAFEGIFRLFTMLFTPIINLVINLIKSVFKQAAKPLNMGNDPKNQREVHEYELTPAPNSPLLWKAFWLKGNTAPQNPKGGDQVRIWVKNHNGRYFFHRGQLMNRNTGIWEPLRISESPLGIYWLIGFLTLLPTTWVILHFILHI